MKIEKIDISKLVHDPANARNHSDKNIEAIKGSLVRFGQQKPIVVTGDNVVIAGNGTLEAAKQLAWKKIEIVRTKLSGLDLVAYGLADNRTSELAEWNEDVLGKLLHGLRENDFDLTSIGFDTSYLDTVVNDTSALDNTVRDIVEKSKVDIETKERQDDKQDDIPEITKNKFDVKLGDVWQLGKHKIMCGDSTIDNNWKIILGKLKCDLVITDPPYGVSYTKKTKEVFNTNNYTEIKNDDLAGDDLLSFFKNVFSQLRNIMSDKCSYYVFSPQGGDSEFMMMMMRESGMKCRHQLIWVKDIPVFSMGRLDYDYKHEPILYGWTKSHDFKRNGSQDKSVWNFPRKENKLHPTMKPVELIENAILNSSDINDLVCDSFLGSGSTLIACEKTGRTCYGIELDPHYCSVIIQRYIDFVGSDKDVKKISSASSLTL